jgi:hypothetical protein
LVPGIDRNSVQQRIGVCKRLEVPGVADQLAVAVRSPIAAIEDEHRPGVRRGQVDCLSVLVSQAEGWRKLTRREAHDISLDNNCGVAWAGRIPRYED